MSEPVDIDDAMRRGRRSVSIDIEIAALADGHQGVVDHAQLIQLGLSSRAISRRVAAGRLHVLHRGVYAVGDRALPRLGRVVAAVYAAGPAAVASHRSAAALHDLRPYHGQPEVIARPGARRRDGIRLHRIPIEPDEITEARGIRVTTVARTLIDLCAVVDKAGVEKALRQAEFHGRFNLREVSRLLDRYPRRPGAAHLRKLIQSWTDSQLRTRSDMEDAFRALVLKAKLPEPEMNGAVELGALTIEADAVWRDAKLIVELDGKQAHLTHAAFEADRERDRAAALAGWLVIRVTWRHLTAEPRRLMQDLRRLLRARRRH